MSIPHQFAAEEYLIISCNLGGTKHENYRWNDGGVRCNIRHSNVGSSKRSEERRVGKECRSRGWRDHEKKKGRKCEKQTGSTRKGEKPRVETSGNRDMRKRTHEAMSH